MAWSCGQDAHTCSSGSPTVHAYRNPTVLLYSKCHTQARFLLIEPLI